MRKPYRFHKRAIKNINAMFQHIPGKWFSTGTRDEREAILWAEEKIKRDLLGEGSRRPLPLREFASGFFTPADPVGLRMRNEKRNRTYADNYYIQHQARLDLYILPRFGDQLIASITDVAIEDWFVSLTSYKHIGKQLADDSKNKVLECFRVILQEAKRQRLVDINMAKEVGLITARNKFREPFNDFDLLKMFPADENKLLDIWLDRKWIVYFLIMRDTGFRPGEVAALSPINYNHELHGIYTESSLHAITREKQARIKTTGKGKSYKVGILTDQTVEQIDKLLKETKPALLDLMLTSNGKGIIPPVANKHLKASLERSGVEIRERTQYCLRHSFETDIAGKVENAILLELMAHTSYRGEYDHRSPEDILRQLQPVREVLENRSKSG